MVQRNKLRLCGHILRKDNEDWVKECTTFEVEGSKKEEDLGKLVSKYVVEIVHKDMQELD